MRIYVGHFEVPILRPVKRTVNIKNGVSNFEFDSESFSLTRFLILLQHRGYVRSPLMCKFFAGTQDMVHDENGKVMKYSYSFETMDIGFGIL